MSKETRICMHVLALILGITGTVLIITHAGWLAYIGITLFVWGNNINQNTRS